MASAGPNDTEQRQLSEFVHLLDKSKQLFNGIRDLPQNGTKQWQGYFGRTFDVFTRLWRYQQQYRQVLDTHYGLKRWQIGEVASKIGQLYYHYYLRTSETSYLLEAFSFYSAIRCRAYYSKASREDRPDLMVKKLRYYARFVVVCLLLKKMKLVRDLIRDLSRQVEEYITSYPAEDQLEWSLILSEVKSFVEADSIVNIFDVDNSTVILSHRLTPYNTPPVEKGVPSIYSLQEILLISNCVEQVKCTEISVDMFWMMQALEREPHEELVAGDDAYFRSPGKENPHKYLLYKPSLEQLLLFLSSGMDELAVHGVMLVYLSADPAFPSSKASAPLTKRPGSYRRGIADAYDFGGVCLSKKKESDSETAALLTAHRPPVPPHLSSRDHDCLYPGDLHAFLRKPLFLIVDSENSHVFLGFPNLFGQACITFASPVDLPAYILEQPRRGSLMSLFLHSPLTAFCYISNIGELSIALWDKCQAHIDRFITDAGRLLVRSPNVDRAYIEFFGDDFMRLLIVRFIFMMVTLRMHRSFRANHAFHPHCHPPLPEGELLNHPQLTQSLLHLADNLDVVGLFSLDNSTETVC